MQEVKYYNIIIKLKDENTTFVFHVKDGEYCVETKNGFLKLVIENRLSFMCAIDALEYFFEMHEFSI